VTEAFSDVEDVSDIVDKLYDHTEKIQTMMLGDSTNGDIAAVSKESEEMLVERCNNFLLGKSVGISTGFADFNKLLMGGWKNNKMIILAGRPASGKTSLALKFAKEAAQKGHPVVIFSLEMDRTELYDKLVVGESGVDSYQYATGEISQGERIAINEAKKKLDKLPIIIDDTPGITLPKIASKLRLYQKQGKCKMAIIDYIQLITPAVKDGNREQEVSRISRGIKTTAKALGIPIVALAQMHRGIEKEKGRMPQLADLRESGSLEQDADIVSFVYRPGKFNEPVQDMETQEILVNCMKIITQKHRGGRTGSVKIRFNESMTEFYDWDSQGLMDAMPAS
jgi:replicative DNA helicase